MVPAPVPKRLWRRKGRGQGSCDKQRGRHRHQRLSPSAAVAISGSGLGKKPSMAGGRGLLAAALLVLGASVPASWSWSMTAAFAPRAGPRPRTVFQPMYRRTPGCRSAVFGGRRASGEVSLQMAGSGASLRVQQMQARLKGLKVQCVSRCLPTPAPGALMCFGEPTTHTHTHTHTHTVAHCSAHPFTGCGCVRPCRWQSCASF